MSEERIVFFDIETTGFSFQKGAKIVEIGCISYEGDEIDIFHRLINPEVLIPDVAFAIHRISDADVRDCPKFSEVADDFLEFIKRDTLIGHNVKRYDIPFINFELQAAGMPKIQNNIIDTVDMFKQRFRDRKYSLDHMCQKFNIDLEEREKYGHGAIVDVELLVECYKNLMQIEVLKPVYINRSQNDK
jgi:DNA polymerase-3 subunit epsilon